MNHLSPDIFFSYETYEERDIFQNCEFVWEVVKYISAYLSKKKLGEIKSAIPDGVFW